MTDPIDDPERCFRVDLDGGASAGDSVPIVTIRLPAARAHALAHLMRDWVAAFRVTPDRRDRPRTYLLGRSIEDATAAVGETGAMTCAIRAAGAVPTRQRLAAAGVLRVTEPTMSTVQRIAVVDAAARWLDEDSDGELALALLRAACSSDVVATQAYVELVSHAPATGDAGDTTEGER